MIAGPRGLVHRDRDAGGHAGEQNGALYLRARCFRAPLDAPEIPSAQSHGRRIGRRLRLASPTKRLVNGSAAATPATSRVVVPLFPHSRSATGAVRRRGPRPTIVTSADSGGMGTPSAPNTLAVLWTSAEGRMSRTLDAPSPSAAKINARWDSDLSPGTRM